MNDIPYRRSEGPSPYAGFDQLRTNHAGRNALLESRFDLPNSLGSMLATHQLRRGDPVLDHDDFCPEPD